jgi:hypothetical protein
MYEINSKAFVLVADIAVLDDRVLNSTAKLVRWLQLQYTSLTDALTTTQPSDFQSASVYEYHAQRGVLNDGEARFWW